MIRSTETRPPTIVELMSVYKRLRMFERQIREAGDEPGEAARAAAG